MGAFIAGVVIGMAIGVLIERADLRAKVSAGLNALWAKRPWA